MNIKLVNAAVNARLTHGETALHDHKLLLGILDDDEFELYLEHVNDPYPGECVVVDQYKGFTPATTGPYVEWMQENMTPFPA
jgi:hypothetical protein